MEPIINFIGRFIRIFHPKVALFLTWILAFMPAMFAIWACWYFGFGAGTISFWAVVSIGCILEFFWGLKTSVWWENDYRVGKPTSIRTFPLR
ncbi:MAG: hypothetical protein EXS51_01925 [Candidatus Taylorbacteria bacterium]|nr:hypothetical protein [Candidatus Taylorbacteria bacterium]